MDAVHDTVPREMGVAEGQHVPGLNAGQRYHLAAEVVRAILGPVESVQRRGSVHQYERRTAPVPASWTHIQTKRKSREKAARLRTDSPYGPLEAEMRELFLPGILVSTAAVLVSQSNRGIVVSCDSEDSAIRYALHHGVWKRTVAHQITEVVSELDALLPNICEDRLQSGEVTVNIGDECYPHPL
jgi:hypothetical protein